MARLKGLRKVEDLVYLAYERGIWQSIIVNTFILLFLALLYNNGHQKPRVLALILCETETLTEIHTDPAPEIQIDSLIESTETGNVDEYLVNTPSEGEVVSVNLDIDEPIDTSSIKEFFLTGRELSETLSDVKTSIKDADPWSDALSTGLGRSSRKGAEGNGDGGGSGGISKIEKRLIKYRAKTGDVQVSISWDNYDDIDVWVAFEGRGYSSNIGWKNRSDDYGGMLDIDCNVSPVTREAVENIFWPKGRAPAGRYTVYVQRFHKWDRSHSTSVEVRIAWDDHVTNKKVNLIDRNMVKVFTFVKTYGQLIPTKPKTFVDSLMSPMPNYAD
jgi:hypothetical protein